YAVDMYSRNFPVGGVERPLNQWREENQKRPRIPLRPLCRYNPKRRGLAGGTWTNMNVLRIRRKLESETLYLPELKPLIGKNVEIIVEEKNPDDPGCFSQLSLPKPLSEKE